MSSKGRMIVAGAAIAAAACLVTACGGSSSSSGSTNSAGSTSGTTVNAPASTGSGLDNALRSTTNSTLGAIVVDSSGRTLYRFDKDSASPPTSNCTGACAQLWPPVLVGTQISLSGIDRSLLGTIKRPDGSIQLTLHGWPLYRYAGDATPGQINGEGIGGTWFAVRPTGAKALASTTASNATTGSNSNSSTGTSTGTGSNSNSNSNSGTSSGTGGYGY